ncbi:unnamed protein product [Nippostrongylus brasiliensis]|uniref:ABC transmembrane type-1 domain-containing protein n=1 Tax=Nippostrongylus brasiliensis TaxID=27835 RepID=A0A0N4XR77_NIPBR|nr:unnamed protein product [Nippostrongylus brasiliensis]VDL68619.1 unnamed protein product [Nippostrongylus brasiliensis]
MWFFLAGYLTLSLSAVTIILQLAYMPMIMRKVENSRDIAQQSIKGFKVSSVVRFLSEHTSHQTLCIREMPELQIFRIDFSSIYTEQN